MVEEGDRKIIPPEPYDGRALGRTLAESVAELVPGGSLLTGMLRVTHPPKAEQEQGRWRRDVSGRTNEHSAQLASLNDQMKLVISTFVKMKTYHKHANDAGELAFFRSGMLAALTKIASGQGTLEDQQRLRDQLADTKPEVDDTIQSRKLTLTKDPFDNRIEYPYDERDQSLPQAKDGHQWDQPLLKQIRYADYKDGNTTKFLATVTFIYEHRPDPFSDYRAGFEIRTTKRCKAILIQTHADQIRNVRRYEFIYPLVA